MLAEQTNPPSNNSGPKRAHPLAAAAWHLLRGRSEADRRLVFEACRRRLDPEPATERQAQALHALERCRGVLGHAPSRREYDAFRSNQPEPRRWPSASFIRAAFGDWPTALAVLGEPQPDVLARRLVSQGKRFEPQDLLALLRRWEQTASRPLLQKHFMEWCEVQARRGTRVPLRSETLRRHFGSWPYVLLTAGIDDARAESAPLASPFDLDAAPQTSRARFARFELLAWLDFLGAQLNPQQRAALSEDAYDELARVVRAQAAAEDRVLRAPASRTLATRFGSWPEAKLAAGLITAAEAAAQPSRAPYRCIELVESGLAALADCGPTMVVSGYRRWRRERLTELAQSNPRARVPSDTLLRQRLGGPATDWAVVIERLLTEADARPGA